MNAAAPPKRRVTAPDDWRILRALSLYRLMLALLLLSMLETGFARFYFAHGDSALFRSTCLAYVAAAGVLLAILASRRPRLTLQAYLQFIIDVTAVLALVWASAGVPGGLAMLLIMPAVGCALVLSTRQSMMLAAIATLALFGEEALRLVYQQPQSAAFTETGILGSVFFVTALVANRVAERARSSEALVERVGSDLASLARLNERVVEAMQAGVVVVEDNGSIRTINAAAQRLLDLHGHPYGQRLDDLAPELTRALVSWKKGGIPALEPMLPRQGAEEVIPRFSRLGPAPDAMVLILLDDARDARERAQQMKLAGLGRLSAGIAHEIRNPLNAISHAGQLLAESPDVPEEDRKLLDMIQRHSARIDRIVDAVLGLSRYEAVTGVLDLAQWLPQAIAHYQEGHGIQRPVQLAPMGGAALSARFDASHLQQVLFNLFDNAFEHGGEDIRVTLRCGRLLASRQPYIEVSDNGQGVAAELTDKIFEPFFTTGSRGAGLGLYLARELCEYNQARLTYAPHSAGGAGFRILLTEVRIG